MKSIVIQSNEVDDACVEAISTIMRRKTPVQLEKLCLYFCRLGWNQTNMLLEALKAHNYIKTLSLVKVSLSEPAPKAVTGPIPDLMQVIEHSKKLQNLDLSWNQLRPKTMKRLLEVICSSKRLQMINVSFNNLCDGSSTEKEQSELVQMLGHTIKHNKELLHLDLSCTGLPSLVIKELGACLKRSPSLLAIHLSDNPGLTKENLEYLP